ncbi:MAG: DUF2007 domain-containing protein [Alphaproteobacteria bacterium]|jgi:Protein of unknown function (DUF2007).|nr:DUF2007 domain-containing protein [Alphaproteobacteria bacterium]MBU0795258.1 DUF2007 domain-containing protein [Alphaproteobacteria bacterium]MBU0877689.1 DUF2007 domain-containing protein [Alphaproteobacteria bacterium]MBU1771514.1 DUF2007 domain-containing protein [Alphaproteobacteria bacterium]
MSLAELARYPDPMLAQIVRGRLEAAGIPAFCFDAGMSVAESAPLAVQARVMVLAEDLDAAQALLAEDAGEESGRSD